MTEVKAASVIKEYFYQDCAIQTWVAEGAGYPVRKVTLACIDNRFVYPGGGAYDGLLRRIDVTAEIGRRKAAVDGIVDDLRAVLSRDEPQIATGAHCSSPYACPFMAHCGARTANTRHVNRRSVHSSGVHSPARVAYPRHFLHFEAIASPVPLWTGTRPYQRIPVLWSCQTETQPGHLVQRAHVDSFDARSKQHFAYTLLDALGRDDGVIVATSAERTCLEALLTSVPERHAELKVLLGRLVHPTGVPSAHVDAVTVQHADITNSVAAGQAWWEAASPETDEERRQRLVESMLRYARQYALLLYEAFRVRISANVTADFGNVTDSARSGVARFRL
jgi:hypothetical protein